MYENKELEWIKEYEKIMFDKDCTIQTATLAAELKLKYMPTILYKYRTVNDQTIEALKEDFLYSSEPRNFNDLLEGPIAIAVAQVRADGYQSAYNKLRNKCSALPDRKINSFQDLKKCMEIGFGYRVPNAYIDGFLATRGLSMDKIDNEAENSILEIQDTARNLYNICCFSAINDNGAMWANYADNNTGICIGYGIKELNSDLTHLTLPVIYRNNEYFEIDDTKDITGNLCMHALSVKSIEWSYEQEWRTFFLANPPVHKEKMPLPKAVYLGAKMNIVDKNKVTDICKKKGIHIYQMKVQLNQPKLIPELIY